MRITNGMISRNFIETLHKSQSELARLSNQMSSGRRFQSGAEDPVAAAREVQLSAESMRISQFEANIKIADSKLSTEDQTLGDAVELLQRAREIYITASNGTTSQDNRISMSQELTHLRDALISLANQKDPYGQFLFSGYQSSNPFIVDTLGAVVYNGDQGGRLSQVGENFTVKSADSGYDVFMDIPAAGGGSQDVFTTLSVFITELQTGAPSADTLENIDNAMSNILNIRGEVGNRLNTISTQLSRLGQINTHNAMTISNLVDTDYAEAVSKFELYQNSSNAAMQTYKQIQSLSLFNML